MIIQKNIGIPWH